MSVASDPVADLSNLWAWFADTSCRGYSPVYERISRAVAEDRELLELVREAPPFAHQPPLLLAAVHYLLLGGLEHPLADVYAGRSEQDPGPLFRDLCLSNRDELLRIMGFRHVQTNEVGRSALIAPSLSWTAKEVGEPLQLVDVGASAGLNLLCDQYLLDYGEFGSIGPPDADVHISCHVVGGRPPIGSRLPPISDRVGIDRDPPDLGDPRDVQWQLACVWPDTGRLARTRSALSYAGRRPSLVRRGDALDLLPEVLSGLPADAVACVVTTWVFAYFSLDARRRFVDLLCESGLHRPVVWIGGEGAGVVDLVEPGELPDHGRGEANVLSAVYFDAGGAHPRLLAFTHPHGLWIDWRA